MSPLKIFIFFLGLFPPCNYALILPKLPGVVEPFFEVTPNGKVIFSDFVKKIDAKVKASLKPDPQTGVSTEDIMINSDTRVEARLFLPKIVNSTRKLPVLLYFHGGGFVIGSAFFSKDDYFLKKLACQANALIISVEYRLWPSHAIPTPYEDGLSALQWLASQRTSPRANPWVSKYGDLDRVFIGGDSAGGNIAHNILMRVEKEKVLPNNVKIIGLLLAMPYFLGSKPVGSETIHGLETSSFVKMWNYVCPTCEGGIDNPWMNPFAPGAPSMASLKCDKLMVYGGTKDSEFVSRAKWYAQGVKKHGFKGKVEYHEGNGGHAFHILEADTIPDTKILIQRFASFLNTM